MPAKKQQPARPAGREEVVDAIVRSAQQLLSEHGPAGVSLRRIAAHAGVNYGLVYQYIGTRERLLQIVYRRLSEQAAERLQSCNDLESALVTIRRPDTGDAYVRMLAWTLLEGYEPSEFLGRSPAMDELVRCAKADLGDDVDSDVLVAVTMLLTLGERLLGPFFTVALGIDDPARVDDAVSRVIAQLPGLLDERDAQT